MNQKAEIDRSNESIKQNEMITQEQSKVFDLQKFVLYGGRVCAFIYKVLTRLK